MNKDLVIKRLKLIEEGKGIGTLSDSEAKIILEEIERLNKELKQQKLHNNCLEKEMLDIVKLLDFEEDGITFTDIKSRIKELKGEDK